MDWICNYSRGDKFNERSWEAQCIWSMVFHFRNYFNITTLGEPWVLGAGWRVLGAGCRVLAGGCYVKNVFSLYEILLYEWLSLDWENWVWFISWRNIISSVNVNMSTWYVIKKSKNKRIGKYLQICCFLLPIPTSFDLYTIPLILEAKFTFC